MYKNGEGVPQNDAEAAKWYRKAADRGHADAQFKVALMYSMGKGVPQNDAEAANWCQKAADQGQADAQHTLGLMYATGRGVLQDDVQAHLWLNLAGASGDDRAAQLRDDVAAKMTPAQIAEAQKLAREWKPK
jgi:TPR repeat protein